MSDHFSPEENKYIARLARIKLHYANVSPHASDINEILHYVSSLNELDTSEVEPLSHVIPLENVCREDEVEESLSGKEALLNAPKQKDGMFIVPKVIE